MSIQISSDLYNFVGEIQIKDTLKENRKTFCPKTTNLKYLLLFIYYKEIPYLKLYLFIILFIYFLALSPH